MYANFILAAVFVGVTVGAYIQGRSDGTRVTRAEYLQRDLQASEEARIAERGIEQRERAKERQWQAAFQTAGQKYQRSLDATATALVTANAVRLFDHGSNNQTCADRTGPVAANPDAANAGGRELSPAFANFLRSEAIRADRLHAKYELCLDALESERVTSP